MRITTISSQHAASRARSGKGAKCFRWTSTALRLDKIQLPCPVEKQHCDYDKVIWTTVIFADEKCKECTANNGERKV